MESHSVTLSGVRARLNFNPARWGVQAYAELGVAVALAAVLGQVRLFGMPQGGSVSLELLPIVFIAARRGVAPALAAGATYGLLQLILPGAFVYHPLQAFLDYPLAFAALAVAGVVGATGLKSLAVAVALGQGSRFVCHFLSGLIFFAEYAPAWEAPWLYAITYNLLYLVPEALLTWVLLWPLLKAYDAAFPGVRAPR
ncbi:MAG TPA: energy-coupled thiamine transporter ThiT [Thermoleophilia bacterium]|nr:energy-coupled thiamine transporter ThiT [Thermoleophilia bacterium]